MRRRFGRRRREHLPLVRDRWRVHSLSVRLEAGPADPTGACSATGLCHELCDLIVSHEQLLAEGRAQAVSDSVCMSLVIFGSLGGKFVVPLVAQPFQQGC